MVGWPENSSRTRPRAVAAVAITLTHRPGDLHFSAHATSCGPVFGSHEYPVEAPGWSGYSRQRSRSGWSAFPVLHVVAPWSPDPGFTSWPRPSTAEGLCHLKPPCLSRSRTLCDPRHSGPRRPTRKTVLTSGLIIRSPTSPRIRPRLHREFGSTCGVCCLVTTRAGQSEVARSLGGWPVPLVESPPHPSSEEGPHLGQNGLRPPHKSD